MMDFITEHWPFFTMALTLWIVGHFMETSVFTKIREKENSPEAHGRVTKDWCDPRSRKEKAHHWFFFWMRESMELHPLLVGVLVGLIWRNPEDADPAWGLAKSCGYFLFAGCVSLFIWLLLTKGLEKLGVKGKIRFPGESIPPEDKS